MILPGDELCDLHYLRQLRPLAWSSCGRPCPECEIRRNLIFQLYVSLYRNGGSVYLKAETDRRTHARGARQVGPGDEARYKCSRLDRGTGTRRPLDLPAIFYVGLTD
ncbi:hypothetical protein E2C01_061039 [Portunus trituberculatus]|uniref:Uncharacterized protein n=1 Tax=Portunus trituberculatus TaxID=210409 RepID=A0A5B7HDZ7_PORTR|nr:hypothetical protein [Portunus trituberculatus]